VREGSVNGMGVIRRLRVGSPGVEIADFQAAVARTFRARDAQRGVDATFRWLTEEVGELARAIRTGERSELELELSDVLAWTASLANLLEVDLEQVAGRYASGCPKCGGSPCTCPL
jgi:NTP pyrophosphatase (non-canonical NTP hydrolase)